MKKKVRKFGSGGMPPIGDSVASGNRVSKQVGAETKKLMPATRSTRPSIGEAVKSGNRMSKENAKDLKAVSKYAKGGKVKKRYADGGVGEMGRAGLDLEAMARTGETLRELDRMDTSVPKVSAPTKKQSFSEAFAAARRAGKKTFTWNGGSYGTKMKGEDDKPAPASTASTSTASTSTATANPAPAKPVAKPAAEPRVGIHNLTEKMQRSRRFGESIGFRNASPAPAKKDEAPTKTSRAEPRVGLHNARKITDTLSSIGRGIGRAVGSIDEQMSTQRRGMATQREKELAKLKEQKGALLKKAKGGKASCYAKGGSVTRGDGIARKGHTKGKMR